MARGRPLTKEQLTEIAEEALRRQDGTLPADTMRRMIEGTATAPEPAAPPKDPPAEG
jgi:hypothetical protein